MTVCLTVCVGNTHFCLSPSGLQKPYLSLPHLIYKWNTHRAWHGPCKGGGSRRGKVQMTPRCQGERESWALVRCPPLETEHWLPPRTGECSSGLRTTVTHSGWQGAGAEHGCGTRGRLRCSFLHFSPGHHFRVRGVEEVVELLGVHGVAQDARELVLRQRGQLCNVLHVVHHRAAVLGVDPWHL